jgi:hypothetical protein
MMYVDTCWLKVFRNRLSDFRKILKHCPDSLWSSEYAVLAAGDYIDELEEENRTLKNKNASLAEMD